MIGRYIDYTLLKPDATSEEIAAICQTAIEHSYYGVCIPPCYVAEVNQRLRDLPIVISTVVDYPYGYSPLEIKLLAAAAALNDGAQELDVVLNIGQIRSGRWEMVEKEISELRLAAQHTPLKLIIEADLLSHPEQRQVCHLAAKYAIDFVKNSTGVKGGDATPDLITRLRALLPPSVKIKASGGIRTPEMACRLLQAGADRIGTSTALPQDYICT